MHEPFSLLIPVYDGDRPDHLRRAFRSAVDDQTVRPDQVVIVRDGPVNAELAACLDDLIATSPVPVTFVPLQNNRGLGPALDRGLAACWFDVVARMDADDVAMPHRFEVELALTAHADIVGSGLLEFVADTDDVVGERVPPTDPDKIRRYARMADPFNPPPDGGLRAFRQDAPGGSQAAERRRAAGLLPSRACRLPAARRQAASCLRAPAAARVPAHRLCLAR